MDDFSPSWISTRFITRTTTATTTDDARIYIYKYITFPSSSLQSQDSAHAAEDSSPHRGGATQHSTAASTFRQTGDVP